MNIFTKIKNKLICIYYCGQVSIASVIAQKHICDSDRTKFGYWTNRYIKYLNKYVNELIKMTGVLEKSQTLSFREFCNLYYEKQKAWRVVLKTI